MAEATAFTAARSQAIEDQAVTGGSVDAAGNLTLVRHNGTTISAGNVKGPQGDPGNNVDAKAYSDAGDATTLASAQSYSDGKLVEAKAYTDGHAMVKGANIPTAANLNTYISNGFFVQVSNANAAAGTNYPRALAGLLEVRTNPDAPGAFVWQKYTVYGGYSPESYVRTYYNLAWTPWTQAGPTGALVRVGTNIKTTDMASISTVAYNINTVTLPNPQTNDQYRVYAKATFNPDTVGMYTELEIKHGANASTGGTQIDGLYIDHRAVGRLVSGVVMGEFTYTGTSGATNYNVVAVGLPGGGGSRYMAASGRQAALYVDKIL